MVADNLREFLENGNIRHSVNFPEAMLPRTRPHRLSIANANVPSMVGQISTTLAEAQINIADLLNVSRGKVGLYPDRCGPAGGRGNPPADRIHRWHTLRETVAAHEP